jgi:CelD/BcsL family acetyltransferase involved in cellulose biosynthesis
VQKSDLTWAIIDSEEEFCALQPEWDAIALARPNASFYHQFAWAYTAWRVDCKPRGMRLHVVTARHEGRIVLIAPVCRDRLGPWRIARWVVPLRHGSCDILTLPVPEATGWVEQAWAQIVAGPFDLVFCRLARSDSRLWPLLTRVPLRRRVYHTLAPAIEAGRYKDGRHYLSTRSKNYRFKMNQSRSRLQREGKLCFRVVEDAAEFPSILDWMEYHKLEWLKSRRHESPHPHRMGWRFIQEVVKIAHGTGNMMLCEITVDGKRIAAALNFITNQRLDVNTISMDYIWQKYSPGQLIVHELVQWAFDHGMMIIDIGTGDQRYKYRVADSEENVMIGVFAPANGFGLYYTYLRELYFYYFAVKKIFIACMKKIPGMKTAVLVVRNGLRSEAPNALSKVTLPRRIGPGRG